MIEQIQGRELDAALANALFRGTRTGHTPFYSTDLNAMRNVEDELERRGLSEKYAEALIKVLRYPELYYTMPGDDVYPEPEIYDNFYGAFQVMHATAEQKARAALAVLTEAEPPDEPTESVKRAAAALLKINEAAQSLGKPKTEAK